jgi:hypothetical protein
MRRFPLLLLAALAASGCSSISKSISSPFESSSWSSRSLESRETKFRREVADYTASFARGDGDFDVFLQGIGSLAARYGVSDWESDPETYEAIGRGLRQADAPPGKMEAYVANVAGSDASRANAIRAGYGR